MVSKRTENWFDAFHMHSELLREKISAHSISKLIRGDGAKGLAGGPSYNAERGRQWDAAVISVLRKLRDYGLEISEDIQVEGLELQRDGTLIPIGPVTVYHNSTSTIGQSFIDQVECLVVAHLMTWYHSACVQAVDPEAYVRQILAEQGIMNSEQFERHSSALLITNPFKDI